MRITNEMVDNFNNLITDCSFKLKFNDEFSNPTCEIVPKNNKYINSSIINLTNEFYQILENFFITFYNIKLSYNNTKSHFWSSNGWE